MKKFSGFTLIELLIASAILSLVLLVGTYAYSLFADKWDKQLGHVNTVAQQVHAITLLDHLLDGIVPLVINSDEGKGFYFSGGQQSLSAISQNGVLTTDIPVVFSLTIEATNNGLYTLLYEEHSLENYLLLSANQDIPFAKSIVLLNNLSDISFQYFGWESLNLKSQAEFEHNSAISRKWLQGYLGAKTQLQPEKINLSLQFTNQKVELSSYFSENSELLLANFGGD